MPSSSGRSALDAVIGETLGRFGSGTRVRQCLTTLIACVRSRSDLLSPRSSTRDRDPHTDCVLGTLAVLVGSWEKSVRDPWDWRPEPGSRLRQFRSLVDHLFARYPVPAFVTQGLLEGPNEHIALYLHLAGGQSARTAPGQVFSRTGARYFLSAPDDLTIPEGVLWSRLREHRAEPGLCRAIVAADRDDLIPASWYDSPFWLNDVIPFLVREWPIARDEVLEIVRFLRRQRYDDADEVWGHGAGEGPLQPELTLRGRTLQSLRRMMVHWRELLAPTMTARMTTVERSWPRTEIDGFECFEQDDELRRWTIRELLTDRDLRIEGARMQHCVATYIEECLERSTSIWTMEVEHRGRSRPALTIEVDPVKRRVHQACGRFNAGPTTVQRTMLERWAGEQSLEIGNLI